MTTDDFLRRQIIPLAYRQLPAGELMARSATGDAEAFIALVCLKYSLVLGLCRKTLGPDGPAEDVAAETFLQLWRQKEKVRDPHAIDGWLTQTATNLANKLIAAQARGRAAGLEWSRRVGESSVPTPPDRAVIQEELVRKIRQALSEQSDGDQRILWAAEQSGGDTQAAEALNLSLSTYRVRLHRARQRLRSLLRKYGVVPVVGVAAFIGSTKNRVAAAIASRWATVTGKVQLLSLGLCAAVAIAGACWTLTRKHRPTSDQVASVIQAPAAPPSAVVVESLQDRNRRIVMDDLVDPLKELLQRFYPGNPIHLVEVRAFGSEVEVEFKTERPPALESGLAERFLGRYCTFRRRYVVYAQPPGSDRWHLMKPAKPLAVEVPIPPLGVVVEVSAGGTEYAMGQRLFDRLPKDMNAETEMLRYLFGGSGEKLRLPAGGNGFAVDAGRMFLVDVDRSMYIRDRAGKWRYEGECPGWWLIAHDGHLYCTAGDDILTRPIDAPEKPWVLWKKIPELKPGESGGFLAIGGDRFYFAVQPNVLCHCPLSDPKAPWVREESRTPLWPDGIAATDDQLFGHNATHLLMRPTRDASAPWTEVGRWPKDVNFLAIDGDRLLAYGGPGPIYSRPLTAGPEVDWEIVGTAHAPPRR